MALPRSAMGLSAVCDCGISLSYSITIYAKCVYVQDYLTLRCSLL